MAEVATYPVEYLYIAMFASLMFAMGFNSNV
ncbi:putative membrane protein [Vibrio cholerae]|nr:putative membrane protein [Vibrio cholerae]AKB03188.1 putative membrane protein [Vibrio cholerae]